MLVKVMRSRGEADLYAPAFNPEGPSEFEKVVAEGEAGVDSIITRRRASDRDLWVVEIEDAAGRHFLTERVRGEKGGPAA